MLDIDTSWQAGGENEAEETRERREGEKGDPLRVSMACVVPHVSADTQEVIEREKIRRKGGKDITDLKQK